MNRHAEHQQPLVTLLSHALVALTIEIDNAFEARMPHRTTGPDTKTHTSDEVRTSAESAGVLFVLLSRALLMFAMDYERKSSRVSLAVGANVLRVLGDTGIRLRDLPAVAGVSKAAIDVALGLLQRSGAVTIERDASATRGKTARLTPAGVVARSAHHERIAAVEANWRRQFGDDVVRDLRRSLDDVADDSSATSPLMRGTEPPAGGWRNKVHRIETLPHFPMVLHRGGFPDGS